MKWRNLKDGACPKCGSTLKENADSETLTCTGATCTFQITAKRCSEIIRDQNRYTHQRVQGEGWERFQS